MRSKAILFGLVISLGVPLAFAQDAAQTQAAPNTPTPHELYCSGVITTEPVKDAAVLITGNGSNFKITFQESDFVYINRGAAQGVKEGDVFLVVRRVTEFAHTPWFKYQDSILRRIGSIWEDKGRLRVVHTLDNTSIAQVEHSCSYLQRGDTVVPFSERPAPPLKDDNKFDRFAAPTNKGLAMVVAGRYFAQSYGAQDVIYVNLGSAQNVRVGDYFRVFRYSGTQMETAYQTRRMAFEVFGFGGVSRSYDWKNTPREVVGEGIVLRTGPNASTVLITHSVREIYAGDYVEMEE